MSKLDLAYSETIGAKAVKVKQDRKCRCCSKTIAKGSNAITASHLMDKKYNVTFKECIDSGLKSTIYKFVPVRHWFCNDCYNKVKKIRFCTNRLNLTTNEVEDIIYSDSFAELSEEQQLEAIQTFYARGLISSKEFDDMEKDLIHCIALREAYFNEF